MSIGIVSTGVYIPKCSITGKEIAEKAGLPIEVVETKLGIKRKAVPGPGDHTCEMGIRAAESALDEAGMTGKDIDLVIYIGEEYKEYPLWTAAIGIQEAIGAHHAWGFDTALRCGTTIMALKLAKSLMQTDDDIKTVLLAGGYRNGDLIDYSNERTRFMFNLGAGGGALILQKEWKKNELLESHIMTDGSFSQDVLVTAGGTKNPITKRELELGTYRLDVTDPVGMKKRLEQKSMDNFLSVIRKSLHKSGKEEEDIAYVAMLHMKRSAHDYVLRELGLSENHSIYLDEYGHIGQIDQILSLKLAEQQEKIKSGDVIVLVSAGIGYAWGATTIIWGNEEEKRC